MKKNFLHGSYHQKFAAEAALFLVGKTDQVSEAHRSPLHGEAHLAEEFLRQAEENYLFRRLYAGFSERLGFVRRTKLEFCQLLLAAGVEASQFGR